MTGTPNTQTRGTSPQRWSWGKKLAIAASIAAVANGLLYVREALNGNAERLNQLKTLESRFANPLLVKLAGARPWGIARLEHRGRRSGRIYRTPLWAMPVSAGFVIAMPFGRDADWTKNLLSADEAALRYQDVDYRVGQPRIEAISGAVGDVPPVMRLVTRILGIEDILRVESLPRPSGAAFAPA